MSAPTTATAANPPHLHYSYPTRQVYHHADSAFGSNSAFLGAPPLLGNGHYNFPPSMPSSMPQPQLPAAAARPSQHSSATDHHSMSAVPGRRKRSRATDWREFYKNGLPKEVIVIDDDTPPPPPSTSSALQRRPAVGMRQQVPAGGENGLGEAGHASKKRKTGVSSAIYDPNHLAQFASSMAQTPVSAGSLAAATISTDRTASAINTTAPTSMSSYYSQAGVSHEPYVAEVVGQKRKRTRQQAAEEARRLEPVQNGDPYVNYHPPPNPPIKAKDVYVTVVPEPSSSRHMRVDDEDGHYIVTPDTNLTERYQICRLLGQGTFGKVVEAYDRRKRTRCAIKIIRSVQKYRDASRIELRVLATLASNDRDNKNRCIHLRDCFDFRNHICIVTDLLGQSVFDFLKSNNFVPFPNSHIQSFARQLFTSVAFLHDLKLIHTDLKPENILLVDSSYQTFTYNRRIPSSSTTVNRSEQRRKVLLDTEIRLIDFGSATFEEEYHSAVVSTRHYRAPEIILGLGWSYPCDIWSIGCILVEFFTGDALFQTHDNIEHLAMMENVCGGKIDPKLVRQVQQGSRSNGGNPAAKYFLRSGRLDFPNAETSKVAKRYVKAMKRLHEIIPANTRFNKLFLDLLQRIFLYDPKSRITAKQALRHPWFKESITDDGSEAAKIRWQRMREKAA